MTGTHSPISIRMRIAVSHVRPRAGLLARCCSAAYRKPQPRPELVMFERAGLPVVPELGSRDRGDLPENAGRCESSVAAREPRQASRPEWKLDPPVFYSPTFVIWIKGVKSGASQATATLKVSGGCWAPFWHVSISLPHPRRAQDNRHEPAGHPLKEPAAAEAGAADLDLLMSKARKASELLKALSHENRCFCSACFRSAKDPSPNWSNSCPCGSRRCLSSCAAQARWSRDHAPRGQVDPLQPRQ